VTSNPEFIFVLRGDPKQAEIFWLDAASPDALILGDQFRLRPRDVVYVETAGITRWSRVINQILPTIRSVDLLNDLSQ
jgi:polysaccharide export outer membrane protein